MIFDLDFDLKNDTEFDTRVTPDDEKKWDKHQGKVVNLLNQYEKTYGFKRSGMTSWAKVSASAFLAPDQISRLAKDKRVTLITENAYEEFSANPPWGNAYVGSEHRSWGFYATNGKTGYAAGSGRRVYIIDSGVAGHDDLPGVVKRVNMACGTSNTDCSTGLATDQYPRVGCYPHATHVAGIIAARGGNNKTSAGVYDGARITSVSVVSADLSTTAVGKCGNSEITLAAIGYGLDYVYRDILGIAPNYANVTGVGIVNISINSGRFGFTPSGVAETNRVALLKLATPVQVSLFEPATLQYVSVKYPGAFIAQSAGNMIAGSTTQHPRYDPVGGRNLCTQYTNQVGANNPSTSLAYTHAFPNNNTTSLTDGIMVVGAIHHDGKAADKGGSPSVPLSGIYDSAGFRNLADHSSNYGPCVDVWAPGNLIYSTWGLHTDPNANVKPQLTQVGVTYTGSGTTSNQGWVFLSGTSMAAPHVAGAAAWLADQFGLTTPAAIEQKVRQYFLPTGYVDRSNAAVNIVQLP